MAETFETLKSKIGDWLGVDTTRLPDSTRGDAINLIQREVLRKHDLRFGENTDTLSLAVNDHDYTLPSNWRNGIDFWYLNPSTGSRVSLGRKSKEEFDILHPDSTKTGNPSVYTIWGSVFYVGPTPSQNLTLNRNWYGFLPDLVDGSPTNTNSFVENAWDVLFFGALAHITRYLIEDARLVIWGAQFESLQADIVSEHQREKSVGRIAQSAEPG